MRGHGTTGNVFTDKVLHDFMDMMFKTYQESFCIVVTDVLDELKKGAGLDEFFNEIDAL